MESTIVVETMHKREMDFFGYDLAYAELRRVSIGKPPSVFECDISCPRRGWYWIEKGNRVRRFFGFPVKTEAGVLLNVKLSGVLAMVGDLPSAILSGAISLPIDLDGLSLKDSGRSAHELSMTFDSHHIRIVARELSIARVRTFSLRDEMKTKNVRLFH